jgi:hypothetical protein
MMKKIYGKIAILFFAAAMLAACSNIMEPPQGRQDGGTGTVHIAIDGDSAGAPKEARTLAPAQTNFTQYTASFSGPGSQADVAITGGSASVNLIPGVWTITVTAYSGTNTESGRGSVTETVVSGQTARADIVISPLAGSGRTGSFAYSVSIPSVDSASLSLTKMPENTALSPIDLKAAASGSSGTAAGTQSLEAGYYLMKIRLEQGGRYAGRTEVAHIYNGLTTEAEYTFTDDDFHVGTGLADGQWHNGNMTVSGPEHYRFPVTAGTLYEVYWNDSDWGSGKTCDIRVSAYTSSGSGIFTNENSAFTTPKTISGQSGTIYLKVEGWNPGNSGTYAIKYSQSGSGDLDAVSY